MKTIWYHTWHQQSKRYLVCAYSHLPKEPVVDKLHVTEVLEVLEVLMISTWTDRQDTPLMSDTTQQMRQEDVRVTDHQK